MKATLPGHVGAVNKNKNCMHILCSGKVSMLFQGRAASWFQSTAGSSEGKVWHLLQLLQQPS